MCLVDTYAKIVDFLASGYLILLLSLALQYGAWGQSANAAGFDPTPVTIPQVEKTSPSPVTTLDLVKLRDFHGSRISPDGKWVAFVVGQAIPETNSYRSGIFIVSTASGGAPISLGSAGSPHWDDINQWWWEDPQWSPDSASIYYRVMMTDTWQIWKWNRTGGPPTQVTHAEYNVQSFQVSPDGDRLFLTIEKPAAIDKQTIVRHGILFDGTFAVVPRPLVDQIVAAREVPTEVWVHNLKDGQDRKATAEESDAYGSWDPDVWHENAKLNAPKGRLFTSKEVQQQQIGRIKVSPNGKMVVYERTLQDPSDSEQLRFPLFARSTVDGGKSVELTPDLYYADQFWWSPDSKEIYYTDYDFKAEDPHPSKVMAISVTSGKARKVEDSAGYQYDYSMDDSGRFLACLHENNTTPAQLQLVDLLSGKTRALVDANPEFQNLQISSAKRIDVSNQYGDRFWAHLVLPANYEAGKRYPLVITTYRDGDSFLRGGAGDEYPIQVFAANGFAVLNFDIGRIRNSKKDDFETKVRIWASPIEGIAAAITKLDDMSVIDRSKIGITGLSHGAEMVTYAISHSDLYRAAISSGAGLDPIAYDLVPEAGRPLYSDTYHLESPDRESRGRWQRVSAALNASHVSTALLINVADSECVYAMQLITELRELKKPVEMFIYPSEEHVKNQPMHRYEIYQRNVDWMRFWLNGEEDPDPAKAEQYARWRELRKLQQEVEIRPGDKQMLPTTRGSNWDSNSFKNEIGH